MTLRVDVHRPGAIVPSDYEYVGSYDAGGAGEPAWGVVEIRKACEDVGYHRNGMIFGHIGKCGVCGANFRYGDLWEHVPSKQLVHLGHDCADKYSLIANRPEFETYLATLKAGRKAAIDAEMRRNRRAKYLSDKPELTQALELDHKILRDMSAKVDQYGELTAKQVAFALRLANEVRNPKPVEPLIPAPVVEGKRQTVQGEIVSCKAYETAYGTTIRITVKVRTEHGAWLAWGTKPASLMRSSSECQGASVGDTIAFDAKLENGRDAHFAIFKRPTNARIVQRKHMATDSA